MTATEVPRDRWGRPLIIPPSGGEPVAYQRASSLGGVIDDLNNLMAWKQRVTAVGLARRPELVDRVGGIVANHDNPVSDAKRDLNSVCKEAFEAGGGSSAASTGTALHDFTQAIDRYGPTVAAKSSLWSRWKDRLAEYANATQHLEVLDIEQFVVCDALRVAGTFDRLVRLPNGRVVVADLKTGRSDPEFPLKAAVQIAAYAHGQRYDPATGERTPLHPDLDDARGLLIHLPATGQGCTLYDLNLTQGWAAAQCAIQVKTLRALGTDALRKAHVA